MADDVEAFASDAYVKVLAAETGASEGQIRNIIAIVGFSRSSIVREARMVAERRLPLD